jgi:hypothetical protein
LHIALLPFLEQDEAYHSYNQSLAIVGPENTSLHTFRIAVFTCPSDSAASEVRLIPPKGFSGIFPDPLNGRWPMRATSYAGNFGTLDLIGLPSRFSNCQTPKAVSDQLDGVFNDHHPIAFKSISDGLSKTMMMVEHSLMVYKRSMLLSPLPKETGLGGSREISAIHYVLPNVRRIGRFMPIRFRYANRMSTRPLLTLEVFLP